MKHLLDRKIPLFLVNFGIVQLFGVIPATANFARQIILGLRKYDRISSGLRSLKWLPKLILNDATLMHKCINKPVLDYLVYMFKQRSQVHNRQTQSSGALDIPLCHLSTECSFRGAKLWNSLNNSIN